MDAFEAAGRNERNEKLVEVRAHEDRMTTLMAEMEAIGEIPADSPYADVATFSPGYIQELCIREQIPTGGWEDDRRRLALEAIRVMGIRGEQLAADRKAMALQAPPAAMYVPPPQPHIVRPAPPRKLTIDDLPENPTGRYEVVKGGRANLGGHMAEVRTGKIVDVASYGRAAIAAMLACGIVLRAEGEVPMERIERVAGAGGARLAVLAVHVPSEVDVGDFLDRLEDAATRIGLETWGVASSPAPADDTPTVPDAGARGRGGRRAKGS